jgi:phosphoribosyl 1,2-cyclic phosphate phosphodiesterase
VKITFLGTGTSHGVPMIGCDCTTCTSTDPKDKRLRASVLVQTGDGTLLVDAGPDLRTQALTYDIRRIDAILFTHGHADHIFGLDEVRRYNALQRQSMACFADPVTISEIRRTFSYVFESTAPKGFGLPEIEAFTVIGQFCVGHTVVQPVKVLHGRRPILGYRIGGFAYLTDCSAIPDESWALLEDLDVLVLDALRIRPHPTHFSLPEAIEAARRVSAARTYFTHVCHDLAHAATTATLPAGMELAYDGLVLECS